MSTRQDRGAGRTPRDEVEEILGLAPGATTAEADVLVALFADAAGSRRSTGALPGEAAAVAAFAAARRPAAPIARRARILASLTTLVTVKTAAAALAVTSVGGLALAAGTGTLSTPLAGHPHHTARPSAVGDNPTTVLPTPTAAALRNAARAAAAADRADAKAGKDHSTSFAGLCTAFSTGRWDNARAAGNPAFTRLVTAAPGGDVADFCDALTAQAQNTQTPTTKDPSSVKGRSADARSSAADRGKGASVSKNAVHGKASRSSAKVKAPATRAKTVDSPSNRGAAGH
jgi:hypothetical protein